MTTFTIDEVMIPADITDPGAADFIHAIEVGNAVEAISFGTTDISYEPAEELPHFLNPHEPIRMLAANVDGRIVGRALYETHTGDGADAAWLATQVLPELRGIGIGTALADAVEALAASDGKKKALVFTPMPSSSAHQLRPPTGFGSIEALVAEAERASGADYRVHFWERPTPEHWLDDLARLATRMSTDAPTAGLEEPEDVWTVERLVESDERSARLDPRRKLTAAVEHIPTGRLVGFTLLSVPKQRHRAADQWATLVLREHRGHGLGMLLKVANLAHLERLAPGHPSVITFNAEENRHMLDVNEAVGFVPIASESAWRKGLG